MPTDIVCQHCGDTSPPDARFCIVCGAALSHAQTGKTTRLAALTPVQRQPHPLQRIRSLPGVVWALLSLVTAILACTTSSVITHNSEKNTPLYNSSRVTETVFQTAPAKTKLPTVPAEIAFQQWYRNNNGAWQTDLDRVIHNYLRAMNDRHAERALQLFSGNQTSLDALERLLLEQGEVLFADYTNIRIHSSDINLRTMEAHTEAIIRYAAGGRGQLQAYFVFENNRWKLTQASVVLIPAESDKGKELNMGFQRRQTTP